MKKPPTAQRAAGGLMNNPAMTYFRTGMHYHRPLLLNGRVRNGNACLQQGIVTGMTLIDANTD